MVTTNGTRALLAAAASSRTVLVASFLNLTATAERIARERPADVALLPPGTSPRRSLTPRTSAGGSLAAILLGNPMNLPATARSCRDDGRILRRLEREPELAANLEMAFTPDLCPVVMRFTADSPGSGWIEAWPAG